jgi:hypothetical protein
MTIAKIELVAELCCGQEWAPPKIDGKWNKRHQFTKHFAFDA